MSSAPNASVPSARLDIGAVLGTSAGLVVRHGLLLVPLALIIMAAVTVPIVVMLQQIDVTTLDSDEYSPTQIGGVLLGFGVILLCMFIGVVAGAGVIAFVVSRSLSGQRVAILDTLVRGVARLPKVLAAGAALGGIFTGVMLIAGLIAAMLEFGGPLVYVGLAGVAAVWLWLTTRYFVVLAAAAVETRGALAPLGRSGHLTAGNRWRIFALVLIVYVAVWALSALIERLTGPELIVPTVEDPALGLLAIELVGDALALLIYSIVPAVAYHELRRIKDGVSADEIAGVFD